MLSDANGLFCIKPSKQAELDFYESAQAHPALLPYLPTFYGALSPGVTAAAAAAAAAASGASLGPASNDVHPALLPAGISTLPTPSSSHPPTNTSTTSSAPKPDVPRLAVAPAPPYGAAIAAEAHVVLANAEHGLARPNALDVKLGARLWAADAPPHKRARLDAVAADTTSGSLGFRVVGMKVWRGDTGDGAAEVGAADGGSAAPTALTVEDGADGGYALSGKAYGRGLTPATVPQAFKAFFFPGHGNAPMPRAGPARKVVRRFLADLRGLRDVLAAAESRMYSASLLFVYEGDGGVLQEKFAREREVLDAMGKGAEGDEEGGGDGGVDGAHGDGGEGPVEEKEGDDSDGDDGPELPTLQVLKLIDFAHASWTPGQGPDENVLHGIRNVVRIFEELLEEH